MAHFWKYPLNWHQDVARNFVVSGARLTATKKLERDRQSFITPGTVRCLVHPLFREDATTALETLTHIFTVSSGLTRYTLSVPTGFGSGAGGTRTMPTTVTNQQGKRVPITKNGITYDLWELPSPMTVRAIQIAFTGTSPKLYELMALSSVLELDADSQFIQINPKQRERASGFHESIAGDAIHWRTASGLKWEIAYGARFLYSESYDAVLDMIASHLQFTFAQDTLNYPDRLYPATFKNQETGVYFISRVKTAGTDVFFEVAEI